MISIDIQELFDGALSDEHAAELLHSLSVSPEKRTDFLRHLKLQNAMKEDKLSSALTADEDALLWGAISGTGAGVATTVAGASLGWFARGAMVVLVGLAGYFLGANPSTNLFDGSEPAPVVAQAPGASRPNALPAPATAPQQNMPQQPASQLAVDAPASSQGAPRSSSPARRSSRASEESRLIAEGSTTVDRSSERATESVSLSEENNPNIPSTPASIDSQKENAEGAQAKESLGGDVDASKPAQQPNDLARRSEEKPLSPEEVNRALGGTNSQTPRESNSARASLLKNGLEVAYGESMGVLLGETTSDSHTPTFNNRHVAITYRFGDGHYGVSTRFGYGSFTRYDLVERLDVTRLSDGNSNIGTIDTVFDTRLLESKVPLIEFVVDYRLPLWDNFAIETALSGGLTTTRGAGSHSKAGAGLSMLWFATDRLGVHAGAGYSRYWYSLDSDITGKTVTNSYRESYTGGMFEGRYGLFYHF